MGWVFFGVGAEGAACWGKRCAEKRQWKVRALAWLSARQEQSRGWKGQPPPRGLGGGGQGMARDRGCCCAQC